MITNYEIDTIKDGVLAEKFSKRRNGISHENFVDAFTDIEIISYELVRMCIYCITLERCKMLEEKISNIVNKLF